MIVWATRDEPDDGPLTGALRAAGLEVIHQPVIARRVVNDAADEISRLGPQDWLVLTSAYAVAAVAREPAKVPRVAVVGDASKEAAVLRGLNVQLVGSGGAKELFVELTPLAVGRLVCYPRSSLALPPVISHDVELISPVLYVTEPREFPSDMIERVDVAAVTSPSAVNAIGTVCLRFASIGPTTSRALEELGVAPWVEAPTPSFAALAGAIADQANDLRHHRA